MPIVEIFQRPGCAPVKVWTDDMEPEARLQLENLSTLPFLHKHVAVMPDVHWGMGSTVGSVIATRNAIIPAAVGVDIGCGMMAARLNIGANELPDNLSGIRSALEAAIPHGRTDNGGKNDRGAWGSVPGLVAARRNALMSAPGILRVMAMNPKLFGANSNEQASRQLGTLGTGNHFVELCLDLEGRVWIMLHSGSRGIGNRIGSYFIERAKEEMERWHIKLPDKNLAYLPDNSPHFTSYYEGVHWAQEYARANRELMMDAAFGAVSNALDRDIYSDTQAVNCHHNYVSQENHFGANVFVTRKGAVRAREGDLGIIPGSMGARSFIVRGKGNADSFCSCSHGAGRKMSRTAAKKLFTIADLEAQTAGVECRKDADVIDEIPGAYKSIDAVMAHQSDLVEIVHELRQIVCVKG